MADGQNVEIVSPAVGQKQNRIGTGKAEFSDYCAFRCQIVFNQRDNPFDFFPAAGNARDFHQF